MFLALSCGLECSIGKLVMRADKRSKLVLPLFVYRIYCFIIEARLVELVAAERTEGGLILLIVH